MKTIHNNLDIIGADLDAKIYCNCGSIFWMSAPEVPYQCSCGKLYQGTIVIHGIEEEDITDNFRVIANILKESHDNEAE